MSNNCCWPIVSDILSELQELPVEESTDEEVSPELSELYQDVELLYRMQTSNISDTREARGLLSKLSFLTGLKLGSFLTSSGTLAASQSINFLGKVSLQIKTLMSSSVTIKISVKL